MNKKYLLIGLITLFIASAIFLFILVNSSPTEKIIQINESPITLDNPDDSQALLNKQTNNKRVEENIKETINKNTNEKIKKPDIESPGILKNIIEIIKDQNKNKENKKEKPKITAHFILSSNPTSEWADFYGNIKIKNNLAEIGDEIAAFDSNNSVIGIYTITSKGKYGFLHIYADDTKTPNKDGAINNEKISFKFYDKDKNKEYVLTQTSLFTSLTKINLDVRN